MVSSNSLKLLLFFGTVLCLLSLNQCKDETTTAAEENAEDYDEYDSEDKTANATETETIPVMDHQSPTHPKSSAPPKGQTSRPMAKPGPRAGQTKQGAPGGAHQGG